MIFIIIPVSIIILSRGIYFTISRFSLVLNEQPLTPTYRPNFIISLSSSKSPVKEWTTPVVNLCLFYYTILIKSPYVFLECKYIGKWYFYAKSKWKGNTLTFKKYTNFKFLLKNIQIYHNLNINKKT